MSLNTSWTSLLQKAATKFFSDKSLGVPWEFDRSINGDKISFSFLEPTIREINHQEYEATFKVRLVCTVSAEGLYDLSDLSGSAAALLLEIINSDSFCAYPVFEKVSIELFDFKNGYKQSLMEQVFTTRLRG